MVKYIVILIPILSLIIGLNVRAWNKTRAESFVDPINWLGALIVVILYFILLWWEKKKP